MSSPARVPQAEARSAGNGAAPEALGLRELRPATRIFLQPIAAPSILGLFGLAGATFVLSTNLANWYGGTTSGEFLFPFAAALGGVAQFAAGVFAYRARDGLATAVHGTWGSFWIAYGVLWLLVATGSVTIPEGTFPELGFWFFALAGITLSTALAAAVESVALFLVLITLAAGSALLGVGYFAEPSGWLEAGGWVLFASAILAWYTATAMLLESTAQKGMLPLGRFERETAVPGEPITRVVGFDHGEPGVRHGQ